jgi:DNA-binding CsgD family transcriptional regulator
VNTAVRRAAIRAGCTNRQAQVLATWVDAETIDDAADQLGISQRAVLYHLRAARHHMNVAHNGTLVAAVLLVAQTRSSTAAGRSSRVDEKDPLPA